MYDWEKKFIVRRNVQFLEENCDHSDEKVKPDESGQADLKFIYPDVNQENESVPVPLLPEAPQVQDNVKPPVQEYVEPAPVQNVETVGVPPRESLKEEEPVRRTYEDAFMEEVRNLGPVRERRMPNKFQDYDCLFFDSEIANPDTVHEALNGKHSDQWKEAMKSEYSSLIKNDTWELVPPPEGKNIIGSRWVLKAKRNEAGSIDRFKARLVAQGYSQVKGVDYEEVFSPVACYTSVRLLLALANAQDLEIHQMGVKTAFLNGKC